ncbi:MAG: MFS transporter [Actinomycetota bacterium]|nr:MFS transporter [Actinomycetota bacterium]
MSGSKPGSTYPEGVSHTKILKSRSGSLSAIWSSRDFRLLCSSQILAGLGEWLATMALIALVWERTHSAIVSGIVLAFRIAPAAVLGSVLASLTARFHRKRVLLACTAGRAAVYGVLPLITGIAPVLALALLAEVAAIAYMSARDATLPRLVPEESLPTANAISMGSAYGSMPVGSGLFALMSLFGKANIVLALATAGAMFALATLIVGRINAHSLDASDAERAEQEHVGLRASFAALRAVFRSDPILRRVGIGGTFAATAGGAVITLGLAYVRTTLHAGSGAYSGLLVSFCFGVVTGVVALQRARKILHKLFMVGVGSLGGILVIMALFPSTAIGFFMGFVFGAAFVMTFLGGITILQERLNDSLRSHAFAVAHSGLRVMAVVTGVFAAWVAKMLGDTPHTIGAFHMDGTQIVFAVAGLLPFAAALSMLRPARARI